jgi:hypothetical protein
MERQAYSLFAPLITITDNDEKNVPIPTKVSGEYRLPHTKEREKALGNRPVRLLLCGPDLHLVREDDSIVIRHGAENILVTGCNFLRKRTHVRHITGNVFSALFVSFRSCVRLTDPTEGYLLNNISPRQLRLRKMMLTPQAAATHDMAVFYKYQINVGGYVKTHASSADGTALVILVVPDEIHHFKLSRDAHTGQMSITRQAIISVDISRPVYLSTAHIENILLLKCKTKCAFLHMDVTPDVTHSAHITGIIDLQTGSVQLALQSYTLRRYLPTRFFLDTVNDVERVITEGRDGLLTIDPNTLQCTVRSHALVHLMHIGHVSEEFRLEVINNSKSMHAFAVRTGNHFIIKCLDFDDPCRDKAIELDYFKIDDNECKDDDIVNICINQDKSVTVLSRRGLCYKRGFISGRVNLVKDISEVKSVCDVLPEGWTVRNHLKSTHSVRQCIFHLLLVFTRFKDPTFRSPIRPLPLELWLMIFEYVNDVSFGLSKRGVNEYSLNM